MEERCLTQHFKFIRERLLQYSRHTGLAKHGDVVGMAREGFIKMFLKENLPTLINYCTGEILDRNDNRTGQIDIIVQSALSPKINLFNDIHISLADFVLGVIEVKSTLTTASIDKSSHLKSSLETFRKVKTLKRKKNLFEYRNSEMGLVPFYLSSTPCFLVAYHGANSDTVVEKIIEYGETNNIKSDEYCPDIIVCLEKKYALIRNNDWLHKRESECLYLQHTDEESCLIYLFMYLCKIIESWNLNYQPTEFNEYFIPLDKEFSNKINI